MHVTSELKKVTPNFVSKDVRLLIFFIILSLSDSAGRVDVQKNKLSNNEAGNQNTYSIL